MFGMKRAVMTSFAVMLSALFAQSAAAAPLVTVGLNLPVVRVAPPVVVVAQPRVWVPAHYTTDRFGRTVWVAGHWQGGPRVREVVAPAPARRVVVVRR